MENNSPLVLTIDFGTQSIRTALINNKGEIEGISKIKYSPCYLTPKKGTAEQDADYYYRLMLQSLSELTKENKDKLSRIKGSTISTFRDTAVLLDKDYKPLRNVVMWLDQRMAKASEKIPTIYRILFAVVGMKDAIVLNRRRTVAHWIKENEPEIWKSTAKYVNISTYLTYKLTGNLVDSAASMIGHYPINFKNRKWYKEGAMKGVIFGIPSRMLCELKQPGEVLGEITPEFAKQVGLPEGIKVYASGSDKACETLGLGALSKDIAALSFGTACTVEVSNVKYHEPEPFLPAYPAAVPGWYNMEVQIYRGFWMISWFTENFAGQLVDEAKLEKMAIEKKLDESLRRVPAGSDGLVLQPYWCPGLRRPLARGGIIGFSDVHTRDHFYRAIVEGIGFALKEGLDGIEKSQGHKVKEIRVSGGGSQSDAICQMAADIFNLPVSRVQTYETTSLGAAIATFVALKEFNSVEEAMNAMSHKKDTFMPIEENHKVYQNLYKTIYVQMYPEMKDLYKDLNKIQHRM